MIPIISSLLTYFPDYNRVPYLRFIILLDYLLLCKKNIYQLSKRILLCRILRRKRVAFKRQFPLRLRTLASLGQTLCLPAEHFCIIGKFEGLFYDTKMPNTPQDFMGYSA